MGHDLSSVASVASPCCPPAATCATTSVSLRRDVPFGAGRHEPLGLLAAKKDPEHTGKIVPDTDSTNACSHLVCGRDVLGCAECLGIIPSGPAIVIPVGSTTVIPARPTAVIPMPTAMMPTRLPVWSAATNIIYIHYFAFITRCLDVIRWFRLVIRSYAIQLKTALRLQVTGLYSFDKSINFLVYGVYTWLNGIMNQLFDF
jgi:hypothetical protein